MRQAIVASCTVPTLCVFVSITGPSSMPPSSIQARPVISPGAVQHVVSGEHRSRDRIASARQDRGDACPHLAAIREVLDQRRLSNHHAGDVGDRIERPRRAFERNAEIACPGTGMGRGYGKCSKQCQDVKNRAESSEQMKQPRRNVMPASNLGADMLAAIMMSRLFQGDGGMKFDRAALLALLMFRVSRSRQHPARKRWSFMPAACSTWSRASISRTARSASRMGASRRSRRGPRLRAAAAGSSTGPSSRCCRDSSTCTRTSSATSAPRTSPRRCRVPPPAMP